MSLTPKNWKDFQHYGDRRPAWIKLHRGLLDDFAFARLPVASRALAPLLWLLASEYEDGKITATEEEIAFRIRMTPSDVNEAIKPLIDHGFFIDDSAPLAERNQEACLEKRDKNRREEKSGSVATATRPADDFEKFWKAYPSRGKGRNPKHPAQKRFDAAVRDGADQAAIIAGAKRYADDMRSSKKLGTEFVARATTWLNDRSWQDYQTPVYPLNHVVIPKHGDTLPDGQVFLRADTPEYDAWCSNHRARGAKIPPRHFYGGWRFPTQWPPGHVVNDDLGIPDCLRRTKA